MAGGLSSAPAGGTGTYHTMSPTAGPQGYVDAGDVVAMAQSQPQPQTGGNSTQNGQAGLQTDVETTNVGLESHLDSFFNSSGWTREDVLVIAAALQIGLWLALLYLEVTE